jgi:O-antigen/teichoic acid export membrane protein
MADNTKQSFFKNSLITLTRQFVSILIGMLLVIVLARFLGPDARGQYALITFLPLMLLTFLNFGINVSTIFFVSKNQVNLQTAVVTNIILACFLGVFSIAVGIAIIHIFSEKYAYLNSLYLYCALLALPFMFLMTFLQTVFQGLQEFKVFNSILLIQQLSTLILVFSLTALLHLDLFGAVLAFIIGYVATVLFIGYMLYRRYHVTIRISDFSFSYVKKLFAYGIKAHISNAFTFLNYRLDVFLLGYFAAPLAVGIYDVAVNIGERLSVFSQSISSVLFPKISSLQKDEERNKITSVVSRNLLLFIVLLSLVVYLLSDFVILLLFGKNYAESSNILKILLPGLALLAVEKVLSNDLAGRGKPEINMYVAIFNVVFNVLLNLYMIPKYRAVGAAISSTLTYSASFFIKVICYQRYTRQRYRSFLVVQMDDFEMYRRFLKKIVSKL